METRMKFPRMDEGTDEDFQLLTLVHERALEALPDLLLSMLNDLSADSASNLNRRDHSLQTATRVQRAGADEDGEIAAAIMHPFISDVNDNLLKHHGLFQTYFYARHLGLDPNARDRFKGEPWYQKTVDFCANWDEVSFDPAYPNEPMSTFEPMLRRVLDKPWIPPTKAK